MDWKSPETIKYVVDKATSVPVLFFVLAVLYRDYKVKVKLMDIIDKKLNNDK